MSTASIRSLRSKRAKKHSGVGLFVIAVIALCAATSHAEERRTVAANLGEIRVMTYNVLDGIAYLDFLPGNANSKDFNTISKDIIASNPAARMAIIARQIANENPDVVGIQETVQLSQPGSQCNQMIVVDTLTTLLDDLKKLGNAYYVVDEMLAFDSRNLNPVEIAIKDVILLRSDLVQAGAVVNSQNGWYTQSLNAGLLATEQDVASLVKFEAHDAQLPTLNFRRALGFVDLNIRGNAIRFATTHLDAGPLDGNSPDSQRSQATQLVSAVGLTPRPIVVTGDFNAPYESYPSLAIYRDAWTAGAGAGPAATCCQANMQDPASGRSNKIDLILLRGPFAVTNIHLVGIVPNSGCAGPSCAAVTPGGQAGPQAQIWGSDHVGVVATLRLPAAGGVPAAQDPKNVRVFPIQCPPDSRMVDGRCIRVVGPLPRPTPVISLPPVITQPCPPRMQRVNGRCMLVAGPARGPIPAPAATPRTYRPCPGGMIGRWPECRTVQAPAQHPR